MSHMKKPLAACLVALSLSGCTVISNLSSGEDDGAQVTGSGKLKTDNRKLSGFHAVEVKGALDCDIKIGKASDVTVEADDNLLPLVKTDVKDGVLIIKTDGNFSTHQSIKVAFTMPELTDGTLSGSGNFNVTG